MGRGRSGSAYQDRAGSWYASVTLPPRRSFRLLVTDKAEAEARKDILVSLVERLGRAAKAHLAEQFVRQAASANEHQLRMILGLVDGLASGTEHEARSAMAPVVTFEAFATRWTSNELAQDYPLRIKRIDHHDNIARFRRHVFPVVYVPSDGRTTAFAGVRIGAIPMQGFMVDHADYVLSRPTLPTGSILHVASIIRRVCNIAQYPGRVVTANPLPPRWAPLPRTPKEHSYLFPHEEAKVLAHSDFPLVKRLLIGFLNREGPRKENAASLTWPQLTLAGLDGGGHVVFDTTKNGRGGAWTLNGTAEALRRWRALCPSKTYVFPASALPIHREKNRPLYVDHLAADLRDYLRHVGVERAALFSRNEHRLRLRAHDLRGTFITLSLAAGQTEDWVRRRTGHRHTHMISRYRSDAETAAELNLGRLVPLHVAIPELAALEPVVHPIEEPALVVPTHASDELAADEDDPLIVLH